MVLKILISGPPRCGKSTLITKLIEYYSKKNFRINGFITPEVREKNRRVGFDIEEIFSDIRFPLARTGNYNTKYKLGKYSVFLDDFEKVISDLENLDFNQVDLIIIDEIGKMELFSKKFQNFIINIFQSQLNIIATIGQKVQHTIKNNLLKFSDILYFHLKRENFELIYEKIIRSIG